MTTYTQPQNGLETLKKFGLDERSARLYLSLLELGEASILKLAKKSGVERTVIYYLLKDLRRFGLVDELYDSHNRLRLRAASPKKLAEYENNRHQQIKAALPELEALYHDQPEKPRIRIFEGLSGVDELYDDVIATLSSLPEDKREMLTYTSVDRLVTLPIRNQEPFRQQRRDKKIKVRVIANNSPLARDFVERDQTELRESRLLPANHDEIKATFVVYANKVAQYNLSGEIYVMSVENKELADTQRIIFELAWAQAA
jgi:sugar-specific transcriptional regulator TrmB